MPRPTRRATQAVVDSVHNLVGKELARQLKAAKKADAPVSAALLTSAIAYLKLTDTRDPAQPRKRPDTLRDAMPDFHTLEMRPPGGAAG